MPIKQVDDLFEITPLEGELDNVLVVTFLAHLLDSSGLTTQKLTQAITGALEMKGHVPVCKDLVGSYVLAESVLMQLRKEPTCSDPDPATGH